MERAERAERAERGGPPAGGFRGCGLAWNGRALERFVILTPRYPAALVDGSSDSPSALATASASIAHAAPSSGPGVRLRNNSTRPRFNYCVLLINATAETFSWFILCTP